MRMTPDMPYSPISCDFHDILEATATRKTVARILFKDADGIIRQQDARITDLETRADGEYMTLETGESIRFDRIVSIDGIALAGYE